MKKSPNDYPLIQFRSKSLTKTLATRSTEQTDSAYSQTAKQDLSDYYALLRLGLPEFSHTERDVLRNALNGWETDPTMAQRLWIEVEAVCDDASFNERIRSLSTFECWCIVQAFKTGSLSCK